MDMSPGYLYSWLSTSRRFHLRARDYDGVPQSFIFAAFPAIGEFILDIFYKSIRSIYLEKVYCTSID